MLHFCEISYCSIKICKNCLTQKCNQNGMYPLLVSNFVEFLQLLWWSSVTKGYHSDKIVAFSHGLAMLAVTVLVAEAAFIVASCNDPIDGIFHVRLLYF